MLDASLQRMNPFEISGFNMKAAIQYSLLPDVCKPLTAITEYTYLLQYNSATNA